MKHIARLATTGGPFCISEVANVGFWNGTEGDYWELIDEQPEGLLSQFVNSNHYNYLIFNSETGSADVFEDHGTLVILEVIRPSTVTIHFSSLLNCHSPRCMFTKSLIATR